MLESRRRATLRDRGREGGRSKSQRALLTVGNLGFIQKELGVMPGAKWRNDSDLRLP